MLHQFKILKLRFLMEINTLNFHTIISTILSFYVLQFVLLPDRIGNWVTLYTYEEI